MDNAKIKAILKKGSLNQKWLLIYYKAPHVASAL